MKMNKGKRVFIIAVLCALVIIAAVTHQAESEETDRLEFTEVDHRPECKSDPDAFAFTEIAQSLIDQHERLDQKYSFVNLTSSAAVKTLAWVSMNGPQDIIPKEFPLIAAFIGERGTVVLRGYKDERTDSRAIICFTYGIPDKMSKELIGLTREDLKD